jgi:ABC-type molybdate transport system permease subunit
MPAVVMGPGRSKAKDPREELLSKLSQFSRKKVFVLLLLWIPPFLSGYYYTLYYFTQQEPAGQIIINIFYPSFFQSIKDSNCNRK